MGFDLLLAGGPNNAIFSDDLMSCLVEVRVEQFLSEPTRFAVRFQDDIENGRLKKSSLPELGIDTLLTIAVSKGDGYACLCRGPILEHETEVTRGGPGSSITVSGPDRRDELDREQRETEWAGLASGAATTILTPIYPGPDVQMTNVMFDSDGNPLTQRSSDLEFLERQAAEYGYYFWVTYEDVAEQPGGSLSLREVAHWKTSPPLQDSPAAAAPPALSLSGGETILRYNVPRGQCPNVTRFDLRVDGERPTQVRTETHNTTDGESDPVDVRDQAAPVGGQGERLADRAPSRALPSRPQGDSQAAQRTHAAVLRESGFYVSANLSTTRHLLKDVLEPHQVIGVEGLGGANGSTPFRVSRVTHVINGIGHFMDVLIKTNVQILQNA